MLIVRRIYKMTKEKKENPYLFCRKKRNLTRDKVNEMIGISSDRLGDIEKNERNAEPEDIVIYQNVMKCPVSANITVLTNVKLEK